MKLFQNACQVVVIGGNSKKSIQDARKGKMLSDERTQQVLDVPFWILRCGGEVDAPIAASAGKATKLTLFDLGVQEPLVLIRVMVRAQENRTTVVRNILHKWELVHGEKIQELPLVSAL